MKIKIQRQDFSFRIIKIGKTAVSIAVCGLLASFSGGAVAEDTEVTSGTFTFTKSVETDSLNLIHGSSGSYTGPLSITLDPGVIITGEIVTGAIPAAIFTSDVRNGGGVDTLSFATASSTTLNLGGDNRITGVVGLHGNLDSNTGGNFYGSYTADPLSLINVDGTGVSFYSAVHAHTISIKQGGTLQFFGNVDASQTFPDSAPGTPVPPILGNTTIDYNGNDATVTLHNGVTVSGDIVKGSGITNGSLIFTGSANITGSVGVTNTIESNQSAMGLVEVRGDDSVVKVGGDLSVDHLNYKAQSVVAVGGDLLLNVNTATGPDGAINSVSLRNTDGTLQVDGNIVGVAAKAAVTTTQNGTGTVTMLGGTQTVTGDLGQSGLSLRQFNVGGAFTAVGLDTIDDRSSNTTVSGDVYATTVSLNNGTSTDSSLTMASGFSITGAVVTEDNERGTLTMAGGTQSVTGTVGAANPGGNWLGTVNSGADAATTTFTDDVFAQNVTNTGTGTSTFNEDVTATNINVNAGTSNFDKSVSATTTTISTGTGNFNTASGTTASILEFSGAGTANLNQGITGAVKYEGNNATVNVWGGETITGNVTTTTNNTGILNYRNSGVIAGTVGSSGLALKELNINTNGANAEANGEVTAQNDLFVSAIELRTHTGTNDQTNEGVLTLRNGADITASTVQTTANNTGSLRFEGSSEVTGAVGTSIAALKDIQVGVVSNTSTVTFNDQVHTTELTYTSETGKNTTVVLNDVSADSPLVGAVNFNSTSDNEMKLHLGNGVTLKTAQTTFKNANNATLRFLGDGSVIGNLGSTANTNEENLRDIYAGANGSVVTFGGDVHVASDTLHVYGTGVVNLQGDLFGPLLYEANGSVNVGDGKEIKGTVRTLTDGEGTLNFVGGTTTQASIGESGKRLSSVGFHNDTTDSTNLPLVEGPVTVNIGHSVFAIDTFIGNDEVGATTANITATGKHLGTNLTLSSNTTLNTAGAVTTAAQAAVDAVTAVSQVDFVHSKDANGTIAPSVLVTKSTTGTGEITTNGATLNFAVGATAWADPEGSVKGAGGTVNTENSSSITGGTGSTLVMNGNEKVNLSLLGSLRNGQSYTLIDVTGNVEEGNTDLPAPGNLKDNSYVINTTLSRANADSGDLVVTATRANGEYITKSATTGHFSNPAALRLGTLAAAGSDYGQDMQTVLNKLDIDQWGYGNNQANLATQVKRLAPVVNNSVGKSALALGAMAADSIGLRMHELRNVPQKSSYESASVWFMNNYQRGTQTAVGNYDGYTNKLTGMSVGLDTRPSNSSIVGAAFSYGTGTVNQTQFRAGDQANLKSTQLSLYGAYDFTPELFLGGSASAAKQNTQGNRATAVGRTALFDFDGTQGGYKVDLGYRINFSNSTTALTPMLTYEGRSLKQDSYTETNAGDIGLKVASERLQSKQLGLGLRLSTTQYVGGMVVKPDLAVSTARERGQDASSIASSFIGDNTSAASFNTELAANSPRTTKVSLGVGVLMSKTSSLMLRYQHVKRDTFTANRAEMTARWDF